ncbi:MAG: thioesterase family protein [Pirellulales bacterium]
MAETFRFRRQVEFRDTDAAGIMHFSTFFLRMEEAEHALLRSVGSTVWRVDDEGKVSWPRVSAHCDYRGPVRFEDWLDVDVQVARLGETSVTYAFRFLCSDRLVAEGQVTAVCCRFTIGQPPRPIPIPAQLRSQLERFLLPAPSEPAA